MQALEIQAVYHDRKYIVDMFAPLLSLSRTHVTPRKVLYCIPVD